ncbi:ABC transporter substrate-binding protein, partial [Streptomyces sp. NPDC054901]
MAAVFLASLLCALATACGGGATTPSKAGGRLAVTVAGSDHLGGAPVHIAEERALWAAEGVDATVTTLPTGRDALNAVLGG